jgi:2,3-bisphosphoglycerate-independent phosphoglycerate mutase
MKYAIIIPDGCADEPLESLGRKTPMQAARLPNMNRIVQDGQIGRANNVPKPLTPASDVATLSLFGYDPLQVYTGRAPLETVAMGIELGPDDWAVRCNLVNVKDEKMHDFTAGHINNSDGARLMKSIQENLGGEVPGGRLEFFPGVQYRNILVFRGGTAPFSKVTKTQPPHDIPEKPIQDYLPQGPGGELLVELMRRSRPLFADHPVNRERIARGEKPATQIWLWGQGRAPSVPSFRELYGPSGAIISAVDLVRGTAMLIGWKRIDAPGATGYLDTDYASKGRTGIEALREHDLVCVHIEAPDEASHEGRSDEKIKALERIDEAIVGPLHEALKSYGKYRILVSPDHRTTIASRAHAYGAVPFAVAGTGITASGQGSYDEITAEKADLEFDPGYRLMSWFLGLKQS